MTDLEKAKHILELLSTTKQEIEGIESAFKLTQSYSWLFTLVKKLEDEENKKKEK